MRGQLVVIYSQTAVHERLGSWTVQFTNKWLLCLELRTRKSSTSWSDKLGVSASAVFLEELSSGKYSESATPIGESVSLLYGFRSLEFTVPPLIFQCVLCVFYKLLNKTTWSQRKTMIAAKWKEKIPISWHMLRKKQERQKKESLSKQ
jgi:hypothetical protein